MSWDEKRGTPTETYRVSAGIPHTLVYQWQPRLIQAYYTTFRACCQALRFGDKIFVLFCAPYKAIEPLYRRFRPCPRVPCVHRNMRSTGLLRPFTGMSYQWTIRHLLKILYVGDALTTRRGCLVSIKKYGNLPGIIVTAPGPPLLILCTSISITSGQIIMDNPGPLVL